LNEKGGPGTRRTGKELRMWLFKSDVEEQQQKQPRREGLDAGPRSPRRKIDHIVRIAGKVRTGKGVRAKSKGACF